MKMLGRMVALLLLGISCLALGQDRPSAPRKLPAREADVLATVGDEAVDRRDVARLVALVTRGQEIHPEAMHVVEAQVLAEIIDRRLVLAYARRTKTYPQSAEIDAALADLKTRLLAQGQSLDDFLKAQGTDLPGLKRQITWNLVWETYLARYVTDERLAACFQSRGREFDGTEISVRHILLQPGKGGGSAAFDDLARRASAIREEIVSGKIRFSDAAKKYSSGPSAAEGGSLGFIPRHGVMDEAFSLAAFALEKGQVSPPVRSRFGVHLIECAEIKPGKRQLAEVREALKEALARELLRKLADVESKHTSVRFTGAGPYFKPGTKDLVVPRS